MTLSAKDMRDLDRYFSGAGHMLRSVQGPILEKCMMMSVKHPPARGPITARPTAEVREEYRVEPNEDDLALFGRVSRKLAMCSALHRQVLEAFYGDDGASCAERHKAYGRFVSLFRFTPAGKTLAKREKLAAGKVKANVKHLIQNAVDRGSASEAADVRVTIGAAHQQALDLKTLADDAYVAAGERIDAQRRRLPPRPLRLTR